MNNWDSEIDNEFNKVANTNVDIINLKTQVKKRFEQDTKHRAFLAIWVVAATSLWLIVVLIIIFFCGFSFMGFHLSDTVLTVLLSTTTLNVLGLPFIVLKGFFKGNVHIDT